ncbi:putative Conserved membrane protein [Trichophyton interdigitale]|uniref:Iron-sulfur assembly protein 1 n=2 Tax=Trichophyton TaxID=5550 RepID=A0A9P4YKQ7_9EURO|nr:putative Conserved membrane protein [Trichophyton interdigitale]KAF3898013.1 putative Conserved membrane protein [Trichophyton interdigitale]KAG8211499.1 putative Conserved membrane protein [Trichophyton interdigitale]
MSLCHTSVKPVTSSALRVLLRRQQRCPRGIRLFSSTRATYSSSKRELQTATAYRPYSLPESVVPPPRNAGTPDTSISHAIPGLNTTPTYPPPKDTVSSKDDGETSVPSYSLPETEAQKSQPVSRSGATAPSETKAKPRKSKLRARKAAVSLTPTALSKLRELVSQPDPKLIRIGVKNRGCSGLSYHLEYVEKPAPFDEVVEQDGVKVLIDSKALFSIIGSEMDWHEDPLSSRFVFNNPNIKDECGCGESFMNSPREEMEDFNRLPLELELLLAIRFSASIPDIFLDIPDPNSTTVAGLKRLVRDRLPPDLTSRRLRLIHAGKSLDDSTSLATQIKVGRNSHLRGHHGNSQRVPSSGSPSEPGSRVASPFLKGGYATSGSSSTVSQTAPDSSGKGKAPARDQGEPRIYIHCSIGDITLTPAELDAEARAARSGQDALKSNASANNSVGSAGLDNSAGPSRLLNGGDASTPGGDGSNITPTPAPQGFDRLLSAGFTPTEVSSLRSQFLALLSLSHTPDTLPSGTELRRLEDRWMDEGSTEAGVAGLGGNNDDSNIFGDMNTDNTGGSGPFGSGTSRALDDMLWGSVMGFFWPVGCALWLLREEGVWSWRKGLAVFVGVVVNFGFGAVRMLS